MDANRGMTRAGCAGQNSIQWTSKYGSVVASAYDMCTTDGVKEAGLSANLLWLVESEYPAYDGSTLGLSIAVWAQYVLDCFASVKEVVEALAAEPFTLVTASVPGEDRLAILHVALGRRG